MSLLPPGPQTDPQARRAEQFGWKMFDQSVSRKRGETRSPVLAGALASSVD